MASVLPDVKENDEAPVTDAVSEQKKTKPPKAYNEATLLSAMENAGRFIEDEELKEQLKDSGLGTPATRAAIIERLIAVKYIERKGKTLVPTEKGMKLIAIVPPEMKSPETTGKWERGLSSVAKGKMLPERFMGSINRYVYYLIGQSADGNTAVVFEQEDRGRGKGKSSAIGKCPLCANGSVFENSKAYFCSGWRNGCKFKIWKNSTEQYGFSLDKASVKKLLAAKKVENVSLTLPQTKEKCRADLVFKDGANGAVEFINLERIPQERLNGE
jgi:DNA topoisomerase-3